MLTLTLAFASDRKLKPEEFKFRFLTEDEIRNLRYGEHLLFVGKDNKVRSVKINGSIKMWKRDKTRLEIPIKYGLYEYAVGLGWAVTHFVKQID